MSDFFEYAGYGLTSGMVLWVTVWGFWQVYNLLKSIGD